MTIQQLSVFIENKSGTLQRVLNLLKEAGIQLIASTIADTVEYGIYRIICSEPKRAYETLKEAGISVALSDVFAITLDNGRCTLSYIEKVDRQVALRKRGCVYENACHYKQHTDQLPKKVSHIQRLPLQGRLSA